MLILSISSMLTSYALAGNLSCGAYASGLQQNNLNYVLRSHKLISELVELEDNKSIRNQNATIQLNTEAGFADFKISIELKNTGKEPMLLRIEPKNKASAIKSIMPDRMHSVNYKVAVQGKAVSEIDLDQESDASTTENDNLYFTLSSKGTKFNVDEIVLSCVDCKAAEVAYSNPTAYNLICPKIQRDNQQETANLPSEKDSENL